MAASDLPFQRSWVTVVGWSPMAVVNSIWRACEDGVVPDRVVLLVTPGVDTVQGSVEDVERYVRAILPQFGVRSPHFEQRDIDENDLQGFSRTLAAVLEEERRIASQLVVDTTPGHKYMSAFSLAQGRRTDLKIERVFYNHMLEKRYIDAPHPLIPRHEHQLYDFLEFLKRR